ncbi:MAG: cytochrome P460 family protein [Salinivirgaceae bacterium]
MQKQLIYSFGAALLIVIVLMHVSCKKEDPISGTDLELYNMATETEGVTWYQNSDILLNRSAASGHTEAFLRTRYNSIASTHLDATGKVKAQTVFNEGSLIVKELWSNESTINRYAILYKQSDHEFADKNGWVWGYINADKTVQAPSSAKGSACISCHMQTDHIDNTLMNKYFP